MKAQDTGLAAQSTAAAQDTVSVAQGTNSKGTNSDHITAVSIWATTTAGQGTVPAASETPLEITTNVKLEEAVKILRKTADLLEAGQAAAETAQLQTVEQTFLDICQKTLGTDAAARLATWFERCRNLNAGDCARFIYKQLSSHKFTDAGDITRIMFRMTIEEHREFAKEQFGALAFMRPAASCSLYQILASSQRCCADLEADERISALSLHQLRMRNIFLLMRLCLDEHTSANKATVIWTQILDATHEQAYTPVERLPSATYEAQVEDNKRVMTTVCSLTIQDVVADLWFWW